MYLILTFQKRDYRCGSSYDRHYILRCNKQILDDDSGAQCSERSFVPARYKWPLKTLIKFVAIMLSVFFLLIYGNGANGLQKRPQERKSPDKRLRLKTALTQCDEWQNTNTDVAWTRKT